MAEAIRIDEEAAKVVSVEDPRVIAEKKKKKAGFADEEEPNEINKANKPKKKGVGFAEATSSEVDEVVGEEYREKKEGVGFANPSGNETRTEGSREKKDKKKGVGFATSENDPEIVVKKEEKKKKKGVGFAAFAEEPLEEQKGEDNNNKRSTGKNVRIITSFAEDCITDRESVFVDHEDGNGQSGQLEVVKAEVSPSAKTKLGDRERTTFDFDMAQTPPASPSVAQTPAAIHLDANAGNTAEGVNPVGNHRSAFTFEDIDQEHNHSNHNSIAKDDYMMTLSDTAGSATESNPNTSPESSPMKSPTYVASAAQFRRIERSSRRYSVAVDVWCGLEDVRDPWKSICWVFITIFGMPLAALVVLFSTYPMVSDTDKYFSLISLLGIFIVAAILVVEVFSTLVCEIEFGIVAHEELPSLYLKTVLGGVALALVMQGSLFDAIEQEKNVWIAVVSVGFIGTFAPLAYTFYTHAPSMINKEIQTIFWAFVAGLFAVMIIMPLEYILAYAYLYTEYSTAADGLVGILFMLLLPAVPLLNQFLVGEYLSWGEGKPGLFAGSVLDILIYSIHHAALCFLMVAGVKNGTYGEIVAYLISQSFTLVCRCVQICSTHSSCMQEVYNLWSTSCKCLSDKRIDIKNDSNSNITTTSEAAKSKYSEGETTDENVYIYKNIEIGASTGHTGEEANSLEALPFKKQTEKIRMITALSSNIIISTLLPLAILIFLCLLNLHPNVGLFYGTRWSVETFNPVYKMLLLFSYQMIAAVTVFYWLNTRGNIIGIVHTQLVFHYTTLLAAAASYAVLICSSVLLKWNGMNQ